MTPIKPVAGAFTPTLPKGWSKLFIPLLDATAHDDVVAGWCSRFLSALNGNEAAFISCCNLIAKLTHAPTEAFTPEERRQIASIIQLTKMLVARFETAENTNRTKQTGR